MSEIELTKIGRFEIRLDLSDDASEMFWSVRISRVSEYRIEYLRIA